MRRLIIVAGYVSLAVILGLSSAIPHYLVWSEYSDHSQATIVATTARGVEVSYPSSGSNPGSLLNSTMVAVYPSAGFFEEPNTLPALTMHLIFTLILSPGIKVFSLFSIVGIGADIQVSNPPRCGNFLDTTPFSGAVDSWEYGKYARNSSGGSIAPIYIDETIALWGKEGCNYPQDSNPFQYLNRILAYPYAVLHAELSNGTSNGLITVLFNMTAFPMTIYRYREVFYVPLLFYSSISLLAVGLIIFMFVGPFRLPKDIVLGEAPAKRRT